jgi:hypothetical protein
MSSTHLRLEGPDLPSLLDQVRAEYGPGARVVHAERIRRGGVGGFFARERYHLEVELHEGANGGGYTGDHLGGRAAGPAAGPGIPTGPTARTVMDLVEQLNQEEHVAHQRHTGAPGASAGGTVPAPWLTGAASQPAPTLLAALASTAAGGTAPMSTESASFADVLSRLQHSVAGTPAPAVTPAVTPVVTPAVTPVAASNPVPVAASNPVPDAAPVAWGDEPPSFVRLGADPWPVAAAPGSPAEALRQSVGHQQPMNPEQLLVLEHSVAPLHSGAPQHSAAPQRPGATQWPGAAQHPVVEPERRERPHAEAGPIRQDAQHLDESAALVARARRLGVPAEVLEDASDAPTVYRRLLSWVESRPPAPLMVPAPGQVIAVVGELSAAMRVARTLSFELGVDPSGIHLAVPATSSGHDVPVGQLLSDPGDIAVRRRRWQQSSGSTIVVVEAALPPAARAWVSSVVSSLAPTFTWAVAQASTKVADVVSWAEVIGAVDAVALENVPATGDPATSLAGPLPIGLLDGRRASVSRWMAMLTMDGGRR